MAPRSSAYPLACLLFLASCVSAGGTAGVANATPMEIRRTTASAVDTTLLHALLGAPDSRFSHVFRDPRRFNLQVVYTRMGDVREGRRTYTDHAYNLDPGSYFYPASTVKMPVAILALQRLRELGVPGLDRNSTMLTGADGGRQTPVYNDPTSADGRPTVAHYIRKIFLVSDNDAYNRLYEFLGPGYINRELQRRGYTEAEVIHRLEVGMTEEENRRTNPVAFMDPGGRILWRQPAAHHREPYADRSERLGLGYMASGRRVDGPMDFSHKNRIHLMSLHRILQSVMFPESVPDSARFNLSEDDLLFLRELMSATPSSSAHPSYDPVEYYDTYCKFLYFGSDPKATIPADMKVYNKVGDAYGHLLDIACFEDLRTGSGFLLSAVVYCNGDGILNDDRYDYDSLGFPLLGEIGRRVFEHHRRESLKAR